MYIKHVWWGTGYREMHSKAPVMHGEPGIGTVMYSSDGEPGIGKCTVKHQCSDAW